MKHSTLSLIGAAAALVVVTGVASVEAPSSDSGNRSSTTAAAARLPVQRSTLLCPRPTSSDVGETTYTGYTPKDTSGRASQHGTASLLPADGASDDDSGSKGSDKKKDKGGKGDKGSKGDQDRSVLPQQDPGTPVTSTTDSSDAPALIGTADGDLAPGWTVQQTTTVDAGTGRGLLGATCTPPDTDFWFPGVSTSSSRQDYVHLTNPDDSAAVVDLDLYGKEGRLSAPTGQALTVPARSTLPVLLSTLTDTRASDVTLHVSARSGRVGASVQSSDEELGGDWLPPSADPATSVVLPGIPKDATSVHLVAYATGGNDADLKVRLLGKNGGISPAGHATLHVKSGMTTGVDLGDVTQGEAGSLVLTPDDSEGPSAPVVAAVRVTRGKGSDREMAFIPSTARIDQRATAADNRSQDSTVSLTAPDASARVRVTSSAGTKGGSPASRTYTVKHGTTLAVPPPSGGKGTFGVTVERLSGGAVYGSRLLAQSDDGLPMFTIQGLPDDRGRVAVPRTSQNLRLLGGAGD